MINVYNKTRGARIYLTLQYLGITYAVIIKKRGFKNSEEKIF